MTELVYIGRGQLGYGGNKMSGPRPRPHNGDDDVVTADDLVELPDPNLLDVDADEEIDDDGQE